MSPVEKVMDYIEAHSDEHIGVEDILLTTKVYALTMLDLLGAE